MGLIDPIEIDLLLEQLEAYNGTITVLQFLPNRTWQPLAGWATVPAVITTDPDRDDVDYVAYVAADNVPTGIPEVNPSMKVHVVQPRMPGGDYAIRLIDDQGGAGLIYRVDLHKV